MPHLRMFRRPVSYAAMSQIAFGRAPVVTLAVFAAFAVAADTGAESRTVIRIYDSAGGAERERSAAIQIAAAIVGNAGIGADWRDCTPDAVRRPCHDPRAAGDLIIRIMPTYVARTGGLAGVRSRASPEAADLVIGVAVVDASTRVGVMATVFKDRVQTVARRAGIEPGVLLGRAIAHEVGHLLLGTRGHSRTGLMREIWTDAELVLNRHEDWRLAR